MSESELKALIDLLDDQQIYAEVKERLIELGKEAIPYLKDVIIHHDEDRVEQARMILEEIHENTFENEWIEMLQFHQETDLELEQAAWLIARFGYPSLDVEYYREKVDRLANEVRERLRPTDTGVTRVRRLIGLLANTRGITGNTENYYDPDNSFLNRVVDRKVGLPISLSVLYLIVASRVDIPLRGVGVPAHFLLRYDDAAADETYYIDPFHAGRVLGRLAVERFCHRLGVGFKEDYLEPVRNAEIINRMLRNLVIVYTKNDNNEQLLRMHRILKLYVRYYPQ